METVNLLSLQQIRFSSIICSRRDLQFPLGFSSSSNLRSQSDITRVLLQDRRTRASSKGIPSEFVEEDPKFVPLNTDDTAFGPPALFLMGFDFNETSKIILCTEDMLTQSIWDVVHTKQLDLKAVKVAKSLPRICFLSGLSGEEMMMFIDAFPEIGLKPAVFAAIVPNSADKLLKDVAEEIMGDHELMQAGKQLS